ncbi:MAG: GTP cyclohydrolase I FolE [Candidatus Thermoplasmatota archaeon]|nr:GTP cyclohydrolase I FolE [Candidatus Thermoplasmatota archaeon]
MKSSRSQSRIEEAVRTILREIGVDENTEVFRNTPRRVYGMYSELFSGLDDKNEPRMTSFKNPGYHDIIAIIDIPFYSMCEHHLLPIFGHVSIAYIPGDRIVGLSKIPRTVKFFSSRPQVQERLTAELADFLHTKLNAKGVMVLVTARHMCMEMRGAKSIRSETLSSAIRGSFETHPETKEEALRLLE